MRLFRFVLPLMLTLVWLEPLRAQTATVTPTAIVVVAADRKVFIKVIWCDPDRSYSRVIEMNNVDITSQFAQYWDPAACGHPGENQADQYYYTDTATVTLDVAITGVHLLEAVATAPGNYLMQANGEYYLPQARRAVQVVPDAQYRGVPLSTGSLSARFVITNTGQAQDTFAIARTCTGGVFNGACGSPSSASVILAANASTAVTVGFTSAASDTGRVWLKATSVQTNVTDSTWTHLTVESAPSAGVTLVGTAPGLGDIQERDLCLTIAVADASASECGDLRLVHPLPAVTTYSTTRAPTLLYNSQHARPMAIVVLDATMPSGTPDSVVAVLTYGGSTRGRRSWPGAQWGSGSSTRRIAVRDTVGAATGAYPFTVTVSRYVSGSPTNYTASGRLHIVDRSASAFGAGWWLAGLEQVQIIQSDTLLWIGGDGSTRIYARSGGAGPFVSPKLDRRDTIALVSSTYVRGAPGNVRVYFSNAGRHDSTLNGVGRLTRFYWTSSTLDSIQVPRPGGTWKYGFTYTSTYLTSVTLLSRTTTLYRTGVRVDSIQDPDNNRVRFTYGASANQYVVASRKDRRGKTTSFSYSTLANRLTQAAAPHSITTTFAFMESRAVDSALILDSAFSQIDGPRSDVSDLTRFWVNGYGAPLRIRNALGQETRVNYDGTWPGLASEVISPMRLRTRAWYHATRGLSDSVIVYNPVGTGTNAKHIYTWDSRWDAVVADSSVISSLVTRAWYQASYPLLDSQRVGSSTARTVGYRYNGSLQLLRVLPPLVAPESLFYDAFGNIERHQTSMGFDTWSYRDSLGRVTLSLNPEGDTTRTWYSVMDRVDSTLSRGDSMTVSYTSRHHPADTVIVGNTYDQEGNLTGVNRRFRLNGTLYSISSTTYFDDVNRVTGDQHPGISPRTLTLDAAGNATTIGTPRGHSITVSYDALNRPTRRVVPQVTFASSDCMLSGSCFYEFPTRDSTNVCFAADTTYLAYDAGGNLRRADNGWAFVHRGYAPNGLVTHDTLSTRTYNTSAPNNCGGNDRHGGGFNSNLTDFTHVYPISYTYDADGRRERLYHPNSVDFCASGQCAQKYEYSTTTGELIRLIVEKPAETPDTALFTYDNLGRLIRTRHLSGVSDSTGYDADSRIIRRINPFVVSADSIVRDALGRVTYATNFTTDFTAAYGPLGPLVFLRNYTQNSGYEEFISDAVGNRRWARDNSSRSNWPGGFDDRQRKWFYNGYAQLDSIRWDTTSSGFPMSANFRTYVAEYDAAGNAFQTAGWDAVWGGVAYGADLNEARYYHDAEDRLRIVNRGINLSGNGAGSVYEEYRYDALGRRILVRSRCTGDTNLATCKGYVERTVWDGQQTLYEFRAAGQDSVYYGYMETDNSYSGVPSGYAPMLGGVGYVHVGGIDQPLGVYRIAMTGAITLGVVPHANFVGEFATGSWINGTYQGDETSDCTPGSHCIQIGWPGHNTNIDGVLMGGAGSSNWMGNLLSQRADGSGLKFNRARYYDPQTGRFTQLDPIGLGGGLNLYGFAGSDPVNYSDAFGLSRCPPHCNRWSGSDSRQVLEQLAGMRTAMNESVVAFGAITTVGALGVGLAGAAEGALVTLGLPTTSIAAGAGSAAAIANRVPFPRFVEWGRTAVSWGSKAEGAIDRMRTITAEQASKLNPVDVRVARDFYQAAQELGRGADTAPARAALLDYIRVIMTQR